MEAENAEGGIGMAEGKELVQEQFAKAAQEYVHSRTHGDPAALRDFVHAIDSLPHWVCLDIATGGGHAAKALAPNVSRVVVTDLTRNMLAAAREHLVREGIRNADYVVADAEDLPFLDTTFDLVTCRIAAHHFPHPDKFVAEAVRVLKPGGMLGFVDNVSPEDDAAATFYNTFEKLRDPSHQRALKVGEWERLFRQHGLLVTRSSLRRKQLDFRSWVKRMVDSDEQAKAVEQYFLEAPPQLQQVFDVVLGDGAVESFTILEWTAVAQKAT
jgi:ubiquinone/menaquinone biosynthesis C-methylase UbiE